MARASKKTRDEMRFGKSERLIDKLANGARVAPRWKNGWDDQLAKSIILEDAFHVDIQNVANHLSLLVKDKKLLTINEWFPCCTPFQDILFMECRYDCMDQSCLIIHDREKSLISGVVYLTAVGMDVFAPIVGFSIGISEFGKIDFGRFHVAESESAAGVTARFSEKSKIHAGSAVPLWIWLQPFLMALSFANCKNASMIAHEPDQNLNRVRRNAGLKPFIRYHTINIEPMKKVLKTEGGTETNGLKKALHICRGHFARYSEDKPLFGHTSGLVWRSAHTRGSVEQGVVVSDYKVNAPKTTA